MDSTLCRIYSSHIVVDRLATLKADLTYNCRTRRSRPSCGSRSNLQ